jgi:malate permease and related proteins
MGFLGVIFPVFGVFVVGYLVQKKFQLDLKGISTISMYIMSPFLVFRTFYNTEFRADYAYMIMFSVVVCFGIIMIIHFIAFFKKYTQAEKSGMILASAFMNSGNYGIPIILMLFGQEGVDYAIILMVNQSLLTSTVGIYFAAKGSPNGNGFKSAIESVFRMPMMYGAVLGTIFHMTHLPLSVSTLSVIDLVADAAIPTIMITLGMQLANLSVKHLEKRKVSLSLSLKLALSPIIAYGITLLLPIDPLLKQVMIIIAAMPTAANTTMLALQFNTKPEFVASSTMIGTILSLVSLPIVFWMVL